MNKLVLIAGAAFALTACNAPKEQKVETENPFFTEYTTPFGVPPFDQIKIEHYLPAFEKGMQEQAQEIEAIVIKSLFLILKIRLFLWTKVENYCEK